MCPRKTATLKGREEELPVTNRGGVDSALHHTIPVYRDNEAGSYIEFYAYDPARGKMCRKTIKLNRIKGKANRRAYARDVIKRLTDQLNKGWNPWVAKDTSDLYLFEEALTRYENHVEKMLGSGYYRKETYAGYKSYVKMLRLYVKNANPIYYVYQFNRKFCVEFLDYVFIDRGNGAQTRNNYLNFLHNYINHLNL